MTADGRRCPHWLRESGSKPERGWEQQGGEGVAVFSTRRLCKCYHRHWRRGGSGASEGRLPKDWWVLSVVLGAV